MKRSLIATLFLVAMIAVASGSRAAPSAPEAPRIGGCRWFCDTTGKAFTTLGACAAACGGPASCEEVC